MSAKSGHVAKDLVELFNKSPLTRIKTNDSLRAGATWSDFDGIPEALEGEYSNENLDTVENSTDIVMNKTNLKARLSKPASLDGALAFSEPSSTSPSIVDIRTSTTGTFLTAFERASHYPSPASPPFELPVPFEAPEQQFSKDLDNQPKAQSPNTTVLERPYAYTTSSSSGRALIMGYEKAPATNVAMVVAQDDPFVDASGPPQRKPAPSQIQDKRLKRPISPATHNFKVSSKGQIETLRSSTARLRERPSSVEKRSALPADEPFFRNLCQGNTSPRERHDLRHNNDLGDPDKVRALVLDPLQREVALGTLSIDHREKLQRINKWVESSGENTLSRAQSCTEEIKISKEQFPEEVEGFCANQAIVAKEEEQKQQTSVRYSNHHFEKFWEKVERKTILPGPFSPEKGTFSPGSSLKSSNIPKSARRLKPEPHPRTPFRTTQSQQNGTSQSLASAEFFNDNAWSETSSEHHHRDRAWLSPGLQPKNYEREVAAAAQKLAFSHPLTRSGSAIHRPIRLNRPVRQPVVCPQHSASTISTELTPRQPVPGPENSLCKSISLDHLRPAPISKTRIFDDHLHPAYRAHPYFNPSDYVNDGISLAGQEVNTLCSEYSTHQQFYSVKGPHLSRDYGKSPMRAEFAEIAKEKSTKAVIKKVRT